MSMAVWPIIVPWSQIAIFVVPPPISTFITTTPTSLEFTIAPDPYAAMEASILSPAETETNLPVFTANNSPIAWAFSRRTAKPVRISAPVSTSSGESWAEWY